jgi:hypothetical protein
MCEVKSLSIRSISKDNVQWQFIYPELIYDNKTFNMQQNQIILQAKEKYIHS